MKLLGPLASGVAGAENGTVEIYRRGTSTFATVYADYDGSGASTPTAGLALDSSGRIVRFVNESVLCLVKSSSGATVATFTDMDSATAVEVISQSFTGTSYSSGASAASLPVMLQAVLDRWLTNSGAIDWKVLIDGSATTLEDAFASLSGLFFNVKAPAYGAAGDGTTDDTSAIQAAIDAANAASGGIVYFPAGTYRIASALTLKIGVSLLGTGPISSIITMDHASNNSLVVNAGVANVAEFVRGIWFSASQANSGKHIAVESGTLINISECTIGNSTFTTGVGVSIANANTTVRITNCDFQHAGTGAGARGVDAPAAGGALITGCRFKSPATWNGRLIHLAVGGIVMGNIVDMSASTAGSGTGVHLTGNTFGAVIIGNFFPTPGSTGVAQYGGTTPLGLAELNSSLDTSFAAPVTTPGTANASHAGSLALTREPMREYQDDNTSPLAVSAAYYRTSEVRHTANTAQTLLLGTPPFAGADFTLVFNNDHGAASNTITVTTCAGLATFTVNANCVSIYFMKAFENVAAGAGSATLRWGLVGSIANIAP